MTALCGGGPSQIRAGVAAVVAVSSAVIAQQLENRGKGWIRNIAPLLVLPPLETQQLCSTDPPGFVDMSAAEVYDAVVSLNLNGDVAAAKAKFAQNITTFAWYALCECASVATPEPPAVTITQPDPMPLPAPAPAGQCGDGGGYGSAAQQISNGGSGQMTIAALAPGATSLATTFTLSVDTNGGWDIPTRFFFTTANNLAISIGPDTTVTLPRAGTYVLSLAIPPTAAYLRAEPTWPGGPVAIDWIQWTTALYCGGVTGVSQPCLPDPSLLAQLEKLLQLVTLIQRQSVPFAYVPGTRHVGLVGSGELAVSGLIGLSVILTTVPAYLGNIAGDPPELFDVGYVTLGTADGFTRSNRVDHNPTLIFPVSAAVTTIGYTLEPNVVADVLELVREP